MYMIAMIISSIEISPFWSQTHFSILSLNRSVSQSRHSFIIPLLFSLVYNLFIYFFMKVYNLFQLPQLTYNHEIMIWQHSLSIRWVTFNFGKSIVFVSKLCVKFSFHLWFWKVRFSSLKFKKVSFKMMKYV